MLDIAAFCQAYRDRIISDVVAFRNHINIFYGSTTQMHQKILQTAL